VTIEERKAAILAKIEEMKAQSGSSDEQLKELDTAYREGVDSL
jgi:hypothetical protein